MSVADALTIKKCEHQVGGHHHIDGTPGSLVDDNGRFYKPLQAGPRADRETAFYAEIESFRDNVSDDSLETRHELELLQRLARFIPRSFGTRPWHDDITLLVLEDVCAAYKQPCIIDIKMGRRTWYPWAPEKLIAKYRDKDESTTQSSLGFRLCGLQVYSHQQGQVHKKDRHWGKGLTEQDVVPALLEFASNGALEASEVLGLMLQQLQQLEPVFQQQTRYQFYSCSVLVTYEGLASCAAEARVRVTLVDFAHVFSSSEGSVEVLRCEAVGGPCIDENFLQGLQSLIGTVQSCVAARN